MRPCRLLSLCCLCLFALGLTWLLLVSDAGLEWDQLVQLTPSPGQSYAVHKILPEGLRGKELEFHQIFEPRLVSFDGYRSPVRKDNLTKTILLWTPWNGVKNTINYYFLRPGNVSFASYGCPNPRCTVTWNRALLSEADVVLFNIRDMSSGGYRDLPAARPRPEQRWIGYILEAPWLCKMDWPKFDGLFNWTMSYREDSDIVVKYGFVGRRGVGEPTSEPGKTIPFADRKSVVWFVSDCKTDSRREDYVTELKRHLDVDVYGKCGDKKCFPAQSSACYADVIGRYKFYLSFENSICRDYVTEKFFNILEYDVVPVVFGGARYKDSTPSGSYVDANAFPDPKDLALFLLRLGDSETEYRTYFRWKTTHRAYLQPWTCSLCDKLHEPVTEFSPAKTDLGTWWVKDAHCKRWTNGKYLSVDNLSDGFAEIVI